MLSRLSVKNFRLLRDVAIDVEPGKPVVLIGPNGAGKSSVIQALDLLGRAARDGWTAAEKTFSNGSSFATVSETVTSLDVTLQQGERATRLSGIAGALRYSLDVRSDIGSSAYPSGESLSGQAEGSDALRLVDREMDVGFGLWNQRTERRDAQDMDPFDKLSWELVKHHDYRALGVLREQLAAMFVYDGFLTTPLWTRDVREGRLTPFDSAVIAPCPRIDRRGLDLVNALHYLQSSHPDEWDELERSFKAEFPFVQRLEFPADPAGGRIGLGWRDRRYPGVRMHGHQMSEGMTTYLCLLTAIISPAPATAIAFDEPDRHLHPSALRRVVHLIEKLSERTAVFVATHSDRFLDYLSDPAGSLRVCEPAGDGVTIRRLDRGALDAWREEYTLSELRERGHIDPDNASAVET